MCPYRCIGGGTLKGFFLGFFMLKIRNWDKFQHYKDRNPPWIKLATDTFQNYEFSCLQDASKLLAICYWTLAARSKDGSAPADLEWVKKQCGLGDFVNVKHLKELIDKGFIIDASNVLATCKQSARPEGEGEGEVEREAEKEIVVRSTKKNEADVAMQYQLLKAFEDFWKIYPKTNCSKKEAMKSWSKIAIDDLPSLATGLKGYIDYLRHEAWQKPAHQTTWLNQRRWEVDYGAIKRTAGQAVISASSEQQKADEVERVSRERREKMFGTLIVGGENAVTTRN